MEDEALKNLVGTIVLGPARETDERAPEGVGKLMSAFNLWIDTIPRAPRSGLDDLDILWITALQKELIWAILAVLCCAYVSALATIRTLFEMLVKAATPDVDGSIGKRIDALAFLKDEERRSLKAELWTETSAWVHPYQRWFARIEQDAMEPETLALFRYDSKLFEECVTKLTVLCDFMLVLALERDFAEPAKVRPHVERLGLTMSGERLPR